LERNNADSEQALVLHTPASTTQDIREEKRSAELPLSSAPKRRVRAKTNVEVEAQRAKTKVTDAHAVMVEKPKVDTTSSTDSTYLPFMIHTPSDTGWENWDIIGLLPIGVHDELIKRLDAFQAETNAREAKYHKLLQNPKKSLSLTGIASMTRYGKTRIARENMRSTAPADVQMIIAEDMICRVFVSSAKMAAMHSA
jgi:hypothetical protein